MALKLGDVVVVPFPYSDQLAEKRRPAVVVSSSSLEADHGLAWLAMITSTSTPWKGDVPISDLKAAGLPIRCAVRPAKVATVSVGRIHRKSGSLTARDVQALMKSLGRYRA